MERVEQWNQDHVERYSKGMRLVSRVFYSRFARGIVKGLPSVGKGSTVVDLGCGPGLLSIELAKLVPDAVIIGVDPSVAMLEAARRNADEAGVSGFETRPGAAERIPLESKSVDLVVTQASLHEWDNVEGGFSEILRVLRPGGSLVIKDFNRSWLSPWKRALVKPFHHVDMFRYSYDDVASFLENTGFTDVEGDPAGLQFLIKAVKP